VEDYRSRAMRCLSGRDGGAKLADYTAPRGRLPGSGKRSSSTAERTRANFCGLLFCQRGGFQG
jgi:hypothetical protein